MPCTKIRVIGPYDCSVLLFLCREHTVSSLIHFNSDAFEHGTLQEETPWFAALYPAAVSTQLALISSD